MKLRSCTKVAIIGTISFIALTVIGFFMADISFESVKKQKEEQKAYAEMTEEERKIYDAYQLLSRREADGQSFNLDDKKTVEFFEEHGMILRMGLVTFLQAKESLGTGEIWHIDDKSCDSSLVSIDASKPTNGLSRDRG